MALIRHVVEHKHFEINGGRVWKFNISDFSYSLKYQYGNVEKIPVEYKINIEDQPVIKRLFKKRIQLHIETDPVLIDKGIHLYSVAGVGEIIRAKRGRKFYKYLLGFNAPEILQSFYETLSIISSVATIKLRDLSQKQREQKIQKDLNQASEIQQNLLPEHYVEFHDYKIFGVCLPDSDIGGDYFDYLKNPVEEEERLGILICDAASKGLPASIQALFVSGAIRMGRSFSPRISQLITRLNNLIFDTFPYERFVTLFYCELTLSSNRLVLYANAGHCSPMHFWAYDKKIRILPPTGGLLGIMKNQKYNIENISLRPGDILALYTDGITECQDSAGNQYGEERLKKIIEKNHKDTPQDLSYKIIDDVAKFSVDSNYTDDKTLVIIKRDPS